MNGDMSGDMSGPWEKIDDLDAAAVVRLLDLACRKSLSMRSSQSGERRNLEMVLRSERESLNSLTGRTMRAGGDHHRMGWSWEYQGKMPRS